MTTLGSQASTLTVESLIASLAESGYIADRGLATSVLLAMRLGKPLLLEGEVGVGKTELAKTLARTASLERAGSTSRATSARVPARTHAPTLSAISYMGGS